MHILLYLGIFIFPALIGITVEVPESLKIVYDVRAVEKVGVMSQPLSPAECHPPDIPGNYVDL
jgi:hypothetical protein